MKNILKILFFSLLFISVPSLSLAINLVGEGVIISSSSVNDFDCENGLTKITPAYNYSYLFVNGLQSISVSSNGEKVCAKLGDNLCKNYENEITSFDDCKKSFALISFKVEDEQIEIKYNYKNIYNNKVKIGFEYNVVDSDDKKVFSDETGKINLNKTGDNKIEDGKNYEYKIYDFITKKILNSGKFKIKNIKKEEGEIVEYLESGICVDGLSLVYKKESYNSYGNLIAGSDKICIKKDDGNCNTNYENEYNSPEDCEMTCEDLDEPDLSSNCEAEEIKDSNDCITGYKITCEINGGNDIVGEIGMEECLDENFPVCGEKDGDEKTYKNICFLVEDIADVLYNGECASDLRDNKGCLKETYDWCYTLKRCLKENEYCSNTSFVPDVSDDLKNSIEGYLEKIYKRIKDKYDNKEKQLQVIDNISNRVDDVISSNLKYKDVLYFILQEVEKKRIYFMSN